MSFKIMVRHKEIYKDKSIQMHTEVQQEYLYLNIVKERVKEYFQS